MVFVRLQVRKIALEPIRVNTGEPLRKLVYVVDGKPTLPQLAENNRRVEEVPFAFVDDGLNCGVQQPVVAHDGPELPAQKVPDIAQVTRVALQLVRFEL